MGAVADGTNPPLAARLIPEGVAEKVPPVDPVMTGTTAVEILAHAGDGYVTVAVGELLTVTLTTEKSLGHAPPLTV